MPFAVWDRADTMKPCRTSSAATRYVPMVPVAMLVDPVGFIVGQPSVQTDCSHRKRSGGLHYEGRVVLCVSQAACHRPRKGFHPSGQPCFTSSLERLRQAVPDMTVIFPGRHAVAGGMIGSEDHGAWANAPEDVCFEGWPSLPGDGDMGRSWPPRANLLDDTRPPGQRCLHDLFPIRSSPAAGILQVDERDPANKTLVAFYLSLLLRLETLAVDCANYLPNEAGELACGSSIEEKVAHVSTIVTLALHTLLVWFRADDQQSPPLLATPRTSIYDAIQPHFANHQNHLFGADIPKNHESIQYFAEVEAAACFPFPWQTHRSATETAGPPRAAPP